MIHLHARQLIRGEIKKKRNALSPDQQIQSAQQVADALGRANFFLKSQNIACYMAKGAELSTLPLIEMIWAQGKNCYLPVLHPYQQGYLCFIQYLPEDCLTKDRFNILEPSYDEVKLISPVQLDLVTMPLIAFDNRGYRLGSGGGYYDRTFAFLKRNTQQKPILCGLAYAFQEISAIDEQEWDIPMQAVVTEKDTQYFSTVPQ